jgi:hypothetical protein
MKPDERASSGQEDPTVSFSKVQGGKQVTIHVDATASAIMPGGVEEAVNAGIEEITSVASSEMAISEPVTPLIEAMSSLNVLGSGGTDGADKDTEEGDERSGLMLECSDNAPDNSMEHSSGDGSDGITGSRCNGTMSAQDDGNASGMSTEPQLVVLRQRATDSMKWLRRFSLRSLRTSSSAASVSATAEKIPTTTMPVL